MPADPRFPENSSGLFVSLFAGFSTALATFKAIQLWIARRRKASEEQSVGIAETTRKTVADIMHERREEVAALKAEISALKAEYAAQAVRHREELAEQSSRHAQTIRALEDKYDHLEEQHYKVLIELATLRKDYDALKARLEGE